MISGTSLRLPESVRLLSLEFDFTDTIEAVRRGETPAVPPVKPTCYAVARSRHRATPMFWSRGNSRFSASAVRKVRCRKTPAQRRNR